MLRAIRRESPLYKIQTSALKGMMEIGNHHITTPIEVTDSDKGLQHILSVLGERLLRNQLFP